MAKQINRAHLESLTVDQRAKLITAALALQPVEQVEQPILLSICIPTIVGREKEFDRLMAFLDGKKQPWMEILVEKDNKEITIGAKRDLLLNRCAGTYFVMIDDDDMLPDDYFDWIYPALLSGADCVGHLEDCFINGKDETSIFTIMVNDWASKKENPNKTAGYDHVRTPFYKSPIKTAIAQNVGFKDISFAEDHEFSKAIAPLLKTEYFIKKPLYRYQPVFVAGENRYGKK